MQENESKISWGNGVELLVVVVAVLVAEFWQNSQIISAFHQRIITLEMQAS